MSNRISWVDRMRGIAMFSVVVQHMTNSLPGDYMYHKFIAISNMAVFFFVSGFIVNQTAHIEGVKQATGFIWKKTKQLIIPMLVWGLVVNHYFFTTDWHLLTLDDLVNEWNRPALWFLLTLFGFMLYYAVYHVLKNKLWGGGKICLLAGGFCTKCYPVVAYRGL